MVSCLTETSVILMVLLCFASALRLREPEADLDDEDIDFVVPPPLRFHKRFPMMGEFGDGAMWSPMGEREVARRSAHFAWRPHSRFGRR
ncbi:unnamed protein product [Mesocestoides corti]|uniref:Uncharacterized protein n=1 Tax=Mesocestoides corti TaxID=53468 RepID=A0A0R3U5I4_MESCO|nr:unnamed protein product [Mesocestoides corti]